MKSSIFRCAFFFAFAAGSAWAQSAGGLGGISGTVRDSSGASVPKAKVVVSNASQGTNRELTTNDSGLFTAPALVPGPGYHVTVTASGFSTWEATDLTLLVGQNLDLNILLAVGQTATRVEVTAAAPLVEDTKTDVSDVVGTKQIMDLPINGRRVDSFVLLTAGVTNDGTFGLLTFRGVAGNNSFLVDGNDATEQFYNENAGRTRIASQISQDAVQEFEVVSTNMSAEYGRATGGVVNTVTRSGTNQLHGTAYWFFRNQDFNAHDPYASINPNETRNQAGGSLGGHLIKDKLFFFLNTEVTRRNFPMVDSIVQNGVIDPVAKQFLGCGAPATPAQCQAINALLPRFYGQVPRTLDQELYFGKLDYYLNNHNTFSASMNYLHDVSPNGIQTGAASTFGSAINGNGNDAVRVRNGRATWTYVPTSNVVNEARWGWSTDRQADTFNNSALGQGLGLLQVGVAGVTLGPPNYLPRVQPSEQRFQYVDNLSWTKGKHIIKMGFDIASTEDYTSALNNAFGGYTYQTVTKFALDYTGNTTGAKNWASYAQAFGNPIVDATIHDYGFYLEDQWRVTNKLTVNLGLRYEYAQLPQPPVVNPNYPQTGHISTGPLNLEPRLGVAYSLNSKTVLRAGYGMFHARFIGSLIDNFWTTNGLYQNAISLSGTSSTQLAAGPVFPNALTAAPAGATVGAATLQFAAPNLKTPYSEQGTVALERQIGPASLGMALTASYIWSRGVQMYGVRDLNLPAISTTNFTYTINNTSGSPVGSYTTPIYLGSARPDPRYGSIYQVENGVNSYYNALAIQARKSFAHGFMFDAAYTWAHEIDDGQSNGSGSLYYSSASNWLYNGNWRADMGSGLLDQRHRFVLSWIWSPTFTHRTDAFSKYVVNNWQLSTITTLQSGRPSGSETIRMTDTPVAGMYRNNTLDGAGLSSRVPFLPVNGLYTPPSYRTDARIAKIIPIKEQYQLYVMFEAFNISNSWSPTFLTSQGFTEAKGVLTPTPAAFGVGTQDGGFPDGTQARRLQLALRFVF